MRSMRENDRAEVRQIASSIASDTIMRYADALARSPFAQQTMDETARRVATDVARAIADERVVRANEVVRAAAATAEETATRTAQHVAEQTASGLGARTEALVLQEALKAVEEALRKERAELDRTLQKEHREFTEALGQQRQQLTETLGQQRQELTETLGAGRSGLDDALAKAHRELDDALGRGLDEVNDTLGSGRSELDDALARGRREISEALGRGQEEIHDRLRKASAELAQAHAEMAETHTELADARAGLTQSVAEFARAVAARAVAAIVADTVPPVVEVRIGEAADPVRVGGHTHVVLPDVLLTLGAGCHVLLVGPAGTGKSMMAQQAAQAFGQEFHALSLGPTTPMSKIFGYYDAHGNYHGTPFRQAFEHGGLMLLDELDSGHPGLLAELNQALSIRTCAFADGMVTAHPDFRLMATANTYGTGGDRQYVGRQALDAATLDRFVIIDVPVDEELEERLALAHAPARPDVARQVIEEVRRLRATAAEKRLPVMFSPRASIDAAKLLQAGATKEQAIRWRVVRGMSAAHRTALGLHDGGAG
jgi:MoxR-like ATPase